MGWVQMITVTLSLLCSSINGISAQLAKPGCFDQCGLIDIPYPFGLMSDPPNCYADEFFAIDCTTIAAGDDIGGSMVTRVRPVLNKLQLEVLSIDIIARTVEVMNPIRYFNCGSGANSSNTQKIILDGTPFSYSSQSNRFTSAGCNTLSALYDKGSYVGGCASVCDGDDKVPSFAPLQTPNAFSNCYGKRCCQTSLPIDGVYVYNVSVQSIGDGNGDNKKSNCSYAFIASNDWLEGASRPGSAPVENHVPAVLDWSLEETQLPVDCFHAEKYNGINTAYKWNCLCPRASSTSNFYIQGVCRAASRDRIGAKATAIGLSSGVGLLLLMLTAYCLRKVLIQRRKKLRKEKLFKQNGGLLLQERFSSGEANADNSKLFSSKELEKATDQFNVNRILGRGGQGTVYKGMLTDGRIVAVKKFKLQGDVEEFINEVVILSQVNHRNVVKLLGFCLETEVPLLVYEFIPNGTLHQQLHEQSEDMPLTWNMRMGIANQVAGALSYLHSAASRPIYHRDIKSSNILLDEVFKAKVADFGASRTISIDQTHLTTNVQGTFGYLDPLYFQSSQYTEKSDVYSYGVVLVELLTGLKPISSSKTEPRINLSAYFMETMAQGRLFEIVDESVLREGSREQIAGVANLARRCLDFDGKKRPTMKEVTMELEGIINLQKENDHKHHDQQEEVNHIKFGDYEEEGPYATFTSSMESTLSDTSTLLSHQKVSD